MRKVGVAHLGLLVAPDPPPDLRRLLIDMRPWCAAVAVDRGVTADAYLASSPRVPGLGAALGSGKPLAVWISDAGEAEMITEMRPAAVITQRRELAVDGTTFFLPENGGLEVEAITPVPPFVRQRIRRRERLPEHLVVDLRGDQLPADVLPAALAICSACIATGAALPLALAYAAPTATDAASAAALGAADGVDIAVGESHELCDLAEDLSHQPRQAAVLSRAGRRLIERQRRRAHVAASVALALRLVSPLTSGWGAACDARLAVLNTPPSAWMRRRIRAASEPFDAPSKGSGAA